MYSTSPPQEQAEEGRQPFFCCRWWPQREPSDTQPGEPGRRSESESGEPGQRQDGSRTRLPSPGRETVSLRSSTLPNSSYRKPVLVTSASRWWEQNARERRRSRDKGRRSGSLRQKEIRARIRAMREEGKVEGEGGREGGRECVY